MRIFSIFFLKPPYQGRTAKSWQVLRHRLSRRANFFSHFNSQLYGQQEN